MFHSHVEINLAYLRENYRLLCQSFPGIAHCPVIKSNAYGHGAVQVARELTACGCKYLAVFNLNEATELRNAGIQQRIIILGGLLNEEIADGIQLPNVVLAVWNRENIRQLSEQATAAGRTVDVHLKIDTGMSRLGFMPEEIPAALELIRSSAGLRLTGAFTHLASADLPPEYQLNDQLAAFREAVKLLPESCTEVHLSAAPGLMADAGLEFPIARPGVTLYGYGTRCNHPELRFKPVMTFKSRVISLKELPAGSRVSYGGTYRIQEQSQLLAVIPVGYSDGYPRALSNQAEVLICGKRAPIRGRICMGMLMVDVSAIPEVAIGSEVVLLGEQGDQCIDAAELAAKIDTIPYELLCSIGNIHHKIYINHG